MAEGLLKNFFPDYNFKNLFKINTNFLLNSDLIIFDLDNTLVFPETTETKKEVLDWFFKIKSKKICLCLSNSRTIKKREKKISNLLGCEVFISDWKKPSKKLFREIQKKYNLSNNNKIIVVGDRIFPDVLFGNLNGATTILVGPLTLKENILSKISRKLENSFIYLLKLFTN